MAVILCNEKNSHNQVNVWAEINDECLKVSGKDFGSACKEKYGFDGYEYCYSFDMFNTRRLYNILSKGIGESGLLKLLAENYGEINACKRLREICDENGIKYSFTSR